MDIELRFPDDRLKEETELACGHRVMARMYRVFVYLCDLHHIQWWAIGGTALAALRGDQILPWSGDIDVAMSRASFARFRLKCADQLPRSMFLQTPDSDPFYKPKHKYHLRDRYSDYYDWANLHPGYKHHNGLQLDIFTVQEGKKPWPSLEPWQPGKAFPLIKTNFLGTDCFLTSDCHYVCETLYGADYMSCTLPNHSGRWHAIRPCDHPQSLNWNEDSNTIKPSSGL